MNILFRSICLIALVAGAWVSAFAQSEPDPWEGYNRRVYSLNTTMDKYLLEPVAKGYDYVAPEGFQVGVRNFFSNIRTPQYIVADLVTGDWCHLWDHTQRFFINTTLGFLGVFDVAKMWGIEPYKTDFGKALARVGVGEGPYVVVPFIGPYTTREVFGDLVDGFLYPFWWLGAADPITGNDGLYYSAIPTAGELLQKRTDLIEGVEAMEESALDPYLFSQGAYLQYRRNFVWDGNPPQKEGSPFADDED